MSTNPFPITTTTTIERANRLISLKAHPGFIDLLRISNDLVQEATTTLVIYPGWDKDQISVLKARAQAAKEHHEQLFTRIIRAIQEGINEAKESELPGKSVSDALEQGDYVRTAVLEKFEDLDSRIPGSY